MRQPRLHQQGVKTGLGGNRGAGVLGGAGDVPGGLGKFCRLPQQRRARAATLQLGAGGQGGRPGQRRAGQRRFQTFQRLGVRLRRAGIHHRLKQRGNALCGVRAGDKTRGLQAQGSASGVQGQKRHQRLQRPSQALAVPLGALRQGQCFPRRRVGGVGLHSEPQVRQRCLPVAVGPSQRRRLHQKLRGAGAAAGAGGAQQQGQLFLGASGGGQRREGAVHHGGVRRPQLGQGQQRLQGLGPVLHQGGGTAVQRFGFVGPGVLRQK